MKKVFFSLFFLTFSLISLRAQSEEAAVRKAIEDETRTFHTIADRNVFLSYWNLNDASIMTYSGGGNVTVIKGEQMKDAVKNGQLPPPDFITVAYENFVVKVSGNVAWASFVQVDTNKDGTKGPRLQEFRMMEKTNGAWKITASSVHELK
jgi:Domain of unknown function (DUF4440)